MSRISALGYRGFFLVLAACLAPWTAGARPFEPPAKTTTESPPPAGPEVQINTVTTGVQSAPDVAAQGTGFVVTWTSDTSAGADTDNTSIQAQRLDAAGVPIGSQVQINDSTANQQYESAVASWSDGNFVVVWGSFETTSFDLFAKVYDSSGSVITAEFEIPTNTGSNDPSVVTAAGDSFLVTWAGFPSDGDGTGIRGARFDAAGNGLAFLGVNSYTTGNQTQPVIRGVPDGSFVVAWKSDRSAGTDSDQSSVQLRHLASDGSPLGEDFQVNTYTTGDVTAVDLAVNDDGAFLVVWGNLGGSPEGDNDGAVVGRRFDSSGATIGDDFQVNSTYTAGSQSPTDLRPTPDGGFVALWEGEAVGSSDPSASAVVSRHYDSAGAAVDDEMIVNTLASGDQAEARLAIDPDSRYLAVWSSDESSGDDVSKSIQGRLFSTAIFQDGFESGETSAWTATVPAGR